ncbi:uncharacterized protein LOC130810617 [Amaranthus tricolor]|uniref:uncharacterized protein LOC130810617 n=1 Tax=Amaranthus tricolor TaxID=29722 RepID=UPI00258A5AC0|nr:uncharacterized protein LOC130810617 [Amaranthus tricolor]
MSWLARSIANSLRIDEHGDHLESSSMALGNQVNDRGNSENGEIEEIDGDLRGVKDDLNEFKDSLTRQLWGVANFLAPPPPTASFSSDLQDQRVITELNQLELNDPSISGDEDDDLSVYARVSMADGDRSEIGVGNLKDYDSSNLRHLGLNSVEEDDDGDGDDDDMISEAAGLTDEVLTFAGNIAHHPETWLDFPVEDEDDMEDFPMSESQKRHTQAVEHLIPRLAALRIELCPTHMSVGFFWKVYFVLLHSRLNKQDAELLSTPEVVEARLKWMQEQQKRAKKESDWFHGGHYARASDEDCTPRSFQNEYSETFSSWTFASEPATSSTTFDSDAEKQAVCTESQSMDRHTTDEKPLAETDSKNVHPASLFKRPVLSFVVDDDEDSDDWPEDDCLQSGRFFPVGIADEVSFSDLEDDDCCISTISKSQQV